MPDKSLAKDFIKQYKSGVCGNVKKKVQVI